MKHIRERHNNNGRQAGKDREQRRAHFNSEISSMKDFFRQELLRAALKKKHQEEEVTDGCKGNRVASSCGYLASLPSFPSPFQTLPAGSLQDGDPKHLGTVPPGVSGHRTDRTMAERQKRRRKRKRADVNDGIGGCRTEEKEPRKEERREGGSRRTNEVDLLTLASFNEALDFYKRAPK